MEYKLKDIVDISSSKRIYYSEYTSSGVPFYRGKEIIEKSENKKISSELFISKERYIELKEKYDMPQKNDILMTAVGTLGVSWLVDESEFYFKDGNLLWFSNFNKNVNSKFLYYFLKSQKFQNIVTKIAIGSTQKAITIQQLKEVVIELPDIKKQNEIVIIFDSINYKINLNNQINDNLQEEIACIYKQCFRETNGTKRADEIANVTIGKTPPRNIKECFSKDDTDEKWISIADLGKCGTYIFDTNEKLTSDAIKKYNVKIIPEETIVLSFKLTIGRVAITTEKMTTNEAIAHFNLYDENMKYYLYSYLKKFDYGKLGSTSSIATAVNSKIIKAMPIAIPKKEDLKNYNCKIASLFKKIKNNEKQNRVLEQLRDTLLPKLMNGEIDLDKIEI